MQRYSNNSNPSNNFIFINVRCQSIYCIFNKNTYGTQMNSLFVTWLFLKAPFGTWHNSFFNIVILNYAWRNVSTKTTITLHNTCCMLNNKIRIVDLIYCNLVFFAKEQKQHFLHELKLLIALISMCAFEHEIVNIFRKFFLLIHHFKLADQPY